jgi:hypothetical protein
MTLESLTRVGERTRGTASIASRRARSKATVHAWQRHSPFDETKRAYALVRTHLDLETYMPNCQVSHSSKNMPNHVLPLSTKISAHFAF